MCIKKAKKINWKIGVGWKIILLGECGKLKCQYANQSLIPNQWNKPIPENPLKTHTAYDSVHIGLFSVYKKKKDAEEEHHCHKYNPNYQVIKVKWKEAKFIGEGMIHSEEILLVKEIYPIMKKKRGNLWKLEG